MQVVTCIPADKLEWWYHESDDLEAHIAEFLEQYYNSYWLPSRWPTFLGTDREQLAGRAVTVVRRAD